MTCWESNEVVTGIFFLGLVELGYLERLCQWQADKGWGGSQGNTAFDGVDRCVLQNQQYLHPARFVIGISQSAFNALHSGFAVHGSQFLFYLTRL